MLNRVLIAGPLALLAVAAGIYDPKPAPGPYDSARLIDEALAREVSGDLPGAERALLDAARIDHLFQPRWTLAGFYFRHGPTADFWKWSRAALDVGTRDLGALFDLCWLTANDSETVWQNAIPNRKVVWNEYLNFLIGAKLWTAASATALRIAGAADLADQPLLMVYCDLAIANRDAVSARPVWNELCRRAVLPFAAASLLVNGDLRTPPTGHGFDWRLPAVPHVRHDLEDGAIRFTFSGYQPEECLLLEQPLVLKEGVSYRFRFEYKTARLAANSGLHWEASSVAGPGFSAPDWTKGEMTVPGGSGTLALIYRRAPGTTTADGVAFLRKMEIAPL